MGLFDFLKLFREKPERIKKKKKKKPLAEPVKKEKKASRVEVIKPLEKKLKPIKPAKKKSGLGERDILRFPHITEKATRLAEENKYTFKVWSGANKFQIKKAVEKAYGVETRGVKIINIHRKKKRMGRHIGWEKGYKKAIVEVKKGQKIELLPR